MQSKYLAEFVENMSEIDLLSLDNAEIREIVIGLCTQEPPFNMGDGFIFNSVKALTDFLKQE